MTQKKGKEMSAVHKKYTKWNLAGSEETVQ